MWFPEPFWAYGKDKNPLIKWILKVKPRRGYYGEPTLWELTEPDSWIQRNLWEFEFNKNRELLTCNLFFIQGFGLKETKKKIFIFDSQFFCNVGCLFVAVLSWAFSVTRGVAGLRNTGRVLLAAYYEINSHTCITNFFISIYILIVCLLMKQEVKDA